ncbi:MAG: hypothetical protein JSW58_07590 [Candidatus Latescibacterota bacterium]|nr:MAG: hypothetical protein JSW58_07590 [Candidatus Latescibacterota bacterium]
MSNLIEETDRQQQRYWKRFLIAFFLLIVLLIVRYVFGTVLKEYELNSHPIGIVVLIISVALLVVMFVHIVKLNRLRARAAANPQLKEALIDNELTKLHLDQSWKAGFIGAAVTPFAFLLISSFHTINDPVLVAFATPIVGSAAFITTFFLKKNR